MSASNAHVDLDDDVRFFDAAVLLWRRRWLIIIVTFAAALGGVAYALLADQWYRAEVLIIASGAGSEGDIGSRIGGVGGLAGLIGAGFGNNSNFVESVAVLKSHDFSREFIDRERLFPIIQKQMHPHGPPKNYDVRDAANYFGKTILAVEDDRKTSLIKVAITWRDPVVAARWANLLVEHLNERLRNRALKEADANIRYLRGELAATNILALQQSISRILEGELQKAMIARGRDDFAFRIVDRAEPPKRRSWPRRTMVVLIATLAGALFSIFGVVVADTVSSLRKRRATA